jgi:glycosyltransferase involved in cell wall biosynthesis
VSFPPAADTRQPKVTHLYFGTDWDPENRTSAHHVARWLADRAPLMYFECPGMRAPRSSGRDIRRIGGKVFAAIGPPRRPAPGVEVRTLLQLPFHRFPGVAAFNRWFLRRSVRRVVARVRRGGGQIVSWFLSPHIGVLAGQLGEDLSVQYCVDDYASFPGVDAGAISAMDEALSRAADLVFVTSDTMLPRKQAIAEHVALSPHGVDVEHFRKATDPGIPLPEEVRTLEGPVIGFFGLIEAWIDLDLIQTLADRHPDWTFVMIGRIAVPAAQVPVRKNILLLGARPYDRLPDYGRRFDVSIIPYRLTQQVHHANPIKLREYLAMEKPIVSVPTPEIEKFADLIRIATTADEWEAAIRNALGTDRASEAAAMRAAADAMTWRARLTRVDRIVADALAGRPFDPPPVSR